jgi:hypothetical protein
MSKTTMAHYMCGGDSVSGGSLKGCRIHVIFGSLSHVSLKK